MVFPSVLEEIIEFHLSTRLYVFDLGLGPKLFFKKIGTVSLNIRPTLSRRECLDRGNGNLLRVLPLVLGRGNFGT